MDIYIVRAGDTLCRLARRFSTTAEALARINQLSDPERLIPNQALLVPGPEPAERPEILVNAFACPGIPGPTLSETLPYLSFLCPFSQRLTMSGELAPTDDGQLVSEALAQGAAPFLTVTNLGESGGFSGEIAHALFCDAAVQDTAIDGILAAVSRRHYFGVNLDLQYLFPFDREAYGRFLRRLSELLHGQGRFLMTSLAPRECAEQEGPLVSAHDYAVHGRWADWVVLMTCDWGCACSAPQAVSPIGRIRRVLDYAVTQMPTGSLLMGLSNGAYRWRLPWRQGDAAEPISSAAAINLAVSVGAELRYDPVAQAPWFCYTDPEGRRCAVWFEDARSLRARLRLVREYELAGLSWWTADRLFRPGLLLQQDAFVAMKLL